LHSREESEEDINMEERRAERWWGFLSLNRTDPWRRRRWWWWAARYQRVLPGAHSAEGIRGSGRGVDRDDDGAAQQPPTTTNTHTRVVKVVQSE
jgi:hypothetical protein